MTSSSYAAALAALGISLSHGSPARADGSCPAPGSLDHEAVETRCDGIDNDCDGLVDFLLPVAENECSPGGQSCRRGHAACSGAERICLGTTPGAEVFDGKDNDCNGVADDVPRASVRSRALLLVPGYLFVDGPLEIANIASMLDQQGVAFDRPASPDDFDRALGDLSSYPLVIVPGYVEEDFLSPPRQAALEAYAAGGGRLVVFKPLFATGSPTLDLIGAAGTERRSDVETLRFESGAAAPLGVFDSPEERTVPLNGPSSGETAWAHVITPAAGTETLGSAVIGGNVVGALVTRRTVGGGAVYALGHDLHAFYHARCYVNCFEPSGDLAGLFLREVFRESTAGHVVLKHSVPGPEDSIVTLTHDLDARDAFQAGEGWGEPGALQVAAIERQHGARGSFFVTTDYSAGYYTPELLRSLCALGVCPVGAHSVVHAMNFGEQPTGTCDETFASYEPERETTLCGEVRVSSELVALETGRAPIAWRSPFLLVHPDQYDVLAGQGFLYDSSYAVGDLKFNLPISLATSGVNPHRFHGQPLYSMPVALEDGLGTTVDGVNHREEMSASNAAKFVSLWSYAMLRNADNHAHTLSLLHPSRGWDAPLDNVRNKAAVLDAFLTACRARGVKVDATVADLVEFWRAREGVDIEARYAKEGYQGEVKVGPHAIRGLTLEFGDDLQEFTCATCGSVTIARNRVVLGDILPAGSLHEFRAVPIAPKPPIMVSCAATPGTAAAGGAGSSGGARAVGAAFVALAAICAMRGTRARRRSAA